MKDPNPSQSPRSVLCRWVAFVVVAALAIGSTWGVWISLRRIGGLSATTLGSSLRVRDVYADSPFQNARPGVAYVGDAACTRCHREIAVSYRSHPMGRSLAPVDSAGEGPPTTAATGLPVESNRVQFTVERRDGRTFHKATRRDAAGSVVAETEAEVRFALGSGTRGTVFLIERDGDRKSVV